MKNRYPFANLRDNQSLVQGTAPKEANISIRLFISSSVKWIFKKVWVSIFESIAELFI
jgi:hypothetical protein